MRASFMALAVATATQIAAAPSPALPPTPPQATVVKADAALTTRADQLIAILDGRGDYDTYFAPSFKAAVSRDKLVPLLAQLKQTLGKPLRIESLAPLTAFSANLVVGYERGTANVRLAVDATAPHSVGGLLVTGTGTRDDSLAKLDADFRALPGSSGYGIYTLGDGAPMRIAGQGTEPAAPLGSAFKLWVLAEAVRQVNAGTRRWSDVVAIGPRSLPSGMLQSWPAGAPVTLQTLATLMIAISDNTATDTLMTTLGRAAVDTQATAHGGTAPVLTTREAFVLKGDAALTRAWTAATPAARTTLLAGEAQRLATAPIDPGMFSGKPLAIDSIEWFASADAMAGLLDMLRKDATAREILAINPGIDTAVAARFGYLGFKGGSEPGVITLNFVAQARDGRWYAVTGNWHRSDTAIEDLRFVGLMTRALALVASR